MINQIFRIIMFVCLHCGLLLPTSFARTCVLPYELGVSTEIEVIANPNAEDMLVIPNHENPVAKWIDTRFYTNGIASDFNQLKVYVKGQWKPWLYLGDNECKAVACNSSSAERGSCIPQLNTIMISDDFTNGDAPCVVKDNRPLGLYGLIAISDNSGQADNPNIENNILTVPSNRFRTFHLGKDAQLQQDSGGYYFTLRESSWYDAASDKIIIDQDSTGKNYVIPGKLYFKILDSQYGDNSGSFKLNIVQGVYDPSKNFIEKTLNYVERTIKEVTLGIYQGIVTDTGFIGIVNALLVFYVAMTGLLYMIGVIQSNKNELIMRLTKVAIIATLISPESWDFFNDYLFSIFVDSGKDISQIIFAASAKAANSTLLNSIPPGSHVMSVFDRLLFGVLYSNAVWIKIYSILVSKYFVYSILIGISICTLTLAILKALVLLFIAMFQVAILLSIMPFFIIMILFNVTKELFDKWILQMVATTVLFILLSITMVLTIIITFGHVEKVFYFGACSKEFLGIIPYYVAYDDNMLGQALSAGNVFGLLFIALLFMGIVNELPKMIDALSKSPIQPISGAYNLFLSNFSKTGFSNEYNIAKLNPAYHNPLWYVDDLAGRPIASVIRKLTK